MIPGTSALFLPMIFCYCNQLCLCHQEYSIRRTFIPEDVGDKFNIKLTFLEALDHRVSTHLIEETEMVSTTKNPTSW